MKKIALTTAIVLGMTSALMADELTIYKPQLQNLKKELKPVSIHNNKNISVAGSKIKAIEFHPYKIKSGKITFEQRKYSTHTSMHIDSNNNVTGSRSNPFYVADEITYYWDNYGDIAYEVDYQVSKFGGDPLPQKVKKYERLWKGKHRYYYNVKKKKVSDDPYYTRIACLKEQQKYKQEGWLAVMYPKAKYLATETVAGKMAKHYKESEMFDFYAWEGLLLRNMNYSTKNNNGKYVRFEPESERVAVNIEADINLNSSIFAPKWLK